MRTLAAVSFFVSVRGPLVAGPLVAGLLAPCALVPLAAAKKPDAQALYQQGMAAGRGGDLRKAAELLKQAVAADPTHFLAQFDLGGAYEELGDKERALACYRKTAELRPDFAEAHTQLGTLYLLHKHDLPQAIAAFKRVLLIPKPYVDERFTVARSRTQALRNLAVAYAESGRVGLAAGIAESLQEAPGGGDAGPAVARIAQMAKRDLLSKLTRAFADELDAIRKPLHGGQAAEALARYQAFAQAHPPASLLPLDRWDLLSGLGLGQAMTGKLAEAAQSFAQAAEAAEGLRYAQWQESMWNRACALAEGGKPAEAVAALEPVLFVDLITAHDPQRAGKVPYRAKIKTDASLKGLQGDPALAALLARYPE